MRVVVVYRPPYSGEHKVPTSVFFDEFSAYLESLLLCKERLLICGDFNIDVDSVDDPDSVKFRDLLESVGLRQHVKKSTHNNGHILDLIIARFTDSTICKEPHVDRFISDHASVICHVLASRPSKATRKITYRKLNSVDTDKIRRDVAASVLCNTVRVDPEDLPVGEIDNLVREYNLTLKNITDHRPSAPWYSAEIDVAKRRRRKAERAWRKNKSEASFKLFKTLRNYVTHLINKARTEYYTDLINKNSDNQGKLFRAAKTLLNTKSELCFPNFSNDAMLSNAIGDFFVRKISKIGAEIDAVVLDQSAVDMVPGDVKFPADKLSALTSFKKLSDEDVRALVTKSAKSYCALDPMPMTLLLDCLDVVLPVISYLVNSSLVHGYFPMDWKEALVKPLLKKPGLEAQFKNLRPISNLQFISKLAERSAYEQTYDHLIKHNLVPELQSAYRKRYSTETALLKVQNDILLNMDRQHVTLLVLLDLSAAFDTVNHEILLRRLETTFGITGTALQWLSSYLGNRSQGGNFLC